MQTIHWEGLNKHLIARIFPVNSQGEQQFNTESITVSGGIKTIDRSNDLREIHAPLLDGSEIEASMNWQSPFENSGAESVSPTLNQMLQSGAIAPIANAANSFVGGDENSFFAAAGQKAAEHEGRSGMTKLNSMQIFTGSMPIRFTFTAVFRAYANPKEEVEKPLAQLWKWALPQYLQSGGFIENILTGQNDGIINAALPSVAPQMVGITYKGRTLAPMVIESISEPTDSPIDSNGNYTQMLLPVTLASLTALDRADWVKSSVA